MNFDFYLRLLDIKSTFAILISSKSLQLKRKNEMRKLEKVAISADWLSFCTQLQNLFQHKKNHFATRPTCCLNVNK